MGKERCKECVFRGTPGKNMCDYAWLTGKTRKAQPAEKCTYFIRGPRLATKEQAEKFLEGLHKKTDTEKKRGGPVKYDWEKAEAMYAAGASDGEIARELGASSTAVFQWRKRMKLPANVFVRRKQNKMTEKKGENENAAG